MKIIRKKGKYIIITWIFLCLFSNQLAQADQIKYDSFQRLIEIQYDNGDKMFYSYDKNGNIVSAKLEKKKESESKPESKPEEQLVVTPTPKPIAKETGSKTVKTKTANYKLAINNKTAVFIGCRNKKIKSITIPATIKYKRKTYKVTAIGEKAFYKCKSLKKIDIKTTTLKKVGKKAFTGTNQKLVIKVPKSKWKAYKKLLKNKGQGRKAKIKK